MKVFQFSLIVTELDDSKSDSVYAQCSDSSIGAGHGVTYVGFDREADNLEEAIQSAVMDLRGLGIEPSRIELDVPAAIES